MTEITSEQLEFYGNVKEGDTQRVKAWLETHPGENIDFVLATDVGFHTKPFSLNICREQSAIERMVIEFRGEFSD